MARDKQYLHNFYNATSTADENDPEEIETYENWLERQLLSRLDKIDELEMKITTQEKTIKGWRDGQINAERQAERLKKEKEQMSKDLRDLSGMFKAVSQSLRLGDPNHAILRSLSYNNADRISKKNTIH